MKIKKTKMTFEQIFDKLDLREYVIVHMKETMVQYLLHAESGRLYEMPEGYLDYDAKHYYRKI